MEPSKNFRRQLLELIYDHDVTKSKFATLVGISTNTLYRATKYGTIPQITPLIKMADYLNVSIDYFIGNTNVNDFIKTNNNSTFHKRLIELCAEQNVKFSKIAHSMPFQCNLFYDCMRRGNLPTLENLYFIAEYFKVSPDYLLGRTDYKN